MEQAVRQVCEVCEDGTDMTVDVINENIEVLIEAYFRILNLS